MGLHSGERSDGLEEVTNRHEVAALTLGEVISDLVRSGGSVGLEGQVVVGDLLTVALDETEHVISHVLVGTLLNSLGASLTELDGTGEGLVKVVLHGRALDTDELAVSSIGVLPVASNLGQVTDTTLGTGGVGSDSVDQSVHTGLEHGLGGTELTSGGSLGVRELLLHTGKDLLLVGGGLVEGDVKLLGRLGEVLGEGAHVTGLAVTSLGESGVRGLRESGDLLLGGGLVLVHELAEHATGTDVGGVASVGDLDDLVALGLDLTVDADLVGLVGDDHGGHNLDVATEASLLLLDLGGQGNDLGGEVLAGVLDILGGGDAGSPDVLDGGRETRVGEGRLLGELVVEVGNGGTHVPVKGLTILGHALVHVTEPLVGPLASGLDTLLHGLDDGGLAGSLELGVDGRGVGLHLSSDDAGVLGHLLGVSRDVAVGLLDLLRGLFLEAEEGTLLGGNGITDLVDDVLLVASDGRGESGTGGTTLLLLGAEALVEGSELGLCP